MSNITLVSCYYKIPSKRTHNEYDLYISNLLRNIRGNMVIYTSEDLVDYLNGYVQNKSNVLIIVKPFDTIRLYNEYSHIWEQQERMDRQITTGRSKFCYILWNSKLDFIKETIESNPFNSDKFMWLDIGSVRTYNIFNYLLRFPIYENVSRNKIDIVLIQDYQNREQRFFQDEIHLGGLYAGGKDILLRFHQLFYEKFNEYLQNNKFVGCDQQIISSVYLENPDMFNIINPHQNNTTEEGKLIPLQTNIDVWFYLLYYYNV